MRPRPSLLLPLVLLPFVALASPRVARAADEDAPVARPQIQALARSYYRSEMVSAFVFVGFGAAQAGGGAAVLTQSGDFARGFGWASILEGGVTLLGGAGYGIAVKIRGDYYTGLADTDGEKFKLEEGEHIHGTNSRFLLYLGGELAEAVGGAGVASYGFATDNDLMKGIGLATAIQGLGLFIIDLPGFLRAKEYADQVRRFDAKVGIAPGGQGRPWAATVGGTF